jgi:hypothetical protein
MANKIRVTPELLEEGPIVLTWEAGEDPAPKSKVKVDVHGKLIEPPAIKRLGDRIEEALSSYGITQEAWIEYKEQHGLPPTCRCPQRKEWINRMDKKFKLSEMADGLGKFLDLMKWKEEK